MPKRDLRYHCQKVLRFDSIADLSEEFLQLSVDRRVDRRLHFNRFQNQQAIAFPDISPGLDEDRCDSTGTGCADVSRVVGVGFGSLRCFDLQRFIEDGYLTRLAVQLEERRWSGT